MACYDKDDNGTFRTTANVMDTNPEMVNDFFYESEYRTEELGEYFVLEASVCA